MPKIYGLFSKKVLPIERDISTVETTTPRTISSEYSIEESIERLTDGIDPVKEDWYSLSGVKNVLALIHRVFSFWENMESSRSEDQEAYECSMAIFQEMQNTMKAMLKQQQPITKLESGLLRYAEKIEIKGKKSLLLAEFIHDYLMKLTSTYLFDHNHQKIKGLEQTRRKAIEMSALLDEKIQSSPYATKKRTTIREVIWSVLIREKRLEALENNTAHRIENLQEIQKKLLNDSLEFLKQIIEYPDNYLPVLNNQEKNELLKDLLFSLNSPESNDFYRCIENSPQASAELYTSFAFTDPEVSLYFNESNPSNRLAMKERLIDKINAQLELPSVKTQTSYFDDDDMSDLDSIDQDMPAPTQSSLSYLLSWLLPKTKVSPGDASVCMHAEEQKIRAKITLFKQAMLHEDAEKMSPKIVKKLGL